MYGFVVDAMLYIM